MLEAVRDPAWQFIGAIIGLVALLATVVIPWLQRRSAAFSYDVLSRTKLLSGTERVGGKLQVLFEGREVQAVELVLLRLVNSGKVPIKEEDYYRPIQVSIGDGAHLLASDLVSKQPPSVEVSLDLAENSLTLAPTLLNPGDNLTLQLVADKVGCPINVEGRIVGVKKIRYAPSRLGRYRAFMLLGVVLALAGVIPLGLDIITVSIVLSDGQLPQFGQATLHMLVAVGFGGVGALITKVAELLFDREMAAIGEASGVRPAGVPAPAS